MDPFTIRRLEKILDGYIALKVPRDVRSSVRLTYEWDENQLTLLTMIQHLFEQDSRGVALLSEHDESTKTPGLFVTGPSVTHGNLMFCFIYKFRQRFAVVGEEIARRLGLDEYRKQGMMLTDLSCCGEDCTC